MLLTRHFIKKLIVIQNGQSIQQKYAFGVSYCVLELFEIFKRLEYRAAFFYYKQN